MSLLLAAAPALAGSTEVQLKEGAGRELVQQNCSVCHSLDYIVMNSHFLGKDQWTAEVHKMIGRFGAPIAPASINPIISYLVEHYGK